MFDPKQPNGQLNTETVYAKLRSMYTSRRQAVASTSSHHRRARKTSRILINDVFQRRCTRRTVAGRFLPIRTVALEMGMSEMMNIHAEIRASRSCSDDNDSDCHRRLHSPFANYFPPCPVLPLTRPLMRRASRSVPKRLARRMSTCGSFRLRLSRMHCPFFSSASRIEKLF